MKIAEFFGCRALGSTTGRERHSGPASTGKEKSKGPPPVVDHFRWNWTTTGDQLSDSLAR